MSLRVFRFIFIALFIIVGAVHHAVESKSYPAMDQVCLDTICKARGERCHDHEGCSRAACGPYGITKPYWIGSGKPVAEGDSPDSDGAYERCVVRMECAQRTVWNLINQHLIDCTGDGRIDCKDFWKIHMLGPHECHKPLSSYWSDLFDAAANEVITQRKMDDKLEQQ